MRFLVYQHRTITLDGMGFWFCKKRMTEFYFFFCVLTILVFKVLLKEKEKEKKLFLIKLQGEVLCELCKIYECNKQSVVFNFSFFLFSF